MKSSNVDWISSSLAVDSIERLQARHLIVHLGTDRARTGSHSSERRSAAETLRYGTQWRIAIFRALGRDKLRA